MHERTHVYFDNVLHHYNSFSAYLGQVSELIGIQQQLLQTPAVAVNLIGHIQQGTVAFIDRLDVTVAPPQGYTVKHHGVMDGRAALKTVVPVRWTGRMQQIVCLAEGGSKIKIPHELSLLDTIAAKSRAASGKHRNAISPSVNKSHCQRGRSEHSSFTYFLVSL